MEEIEIVATVNKAADNGEVGEMWKETKVFKISDSLLDVMAWATLRHEGNKQIVLFRGNLTLTISQK